jgi:hypothetical protein
MSVCVSGGGTSVLVCNCCVAARAVRTRLYVAVHVSYVMDRRVMMPYFKAVQRISVAGSELL